MQSKKIVNINSGSNVGNIIDINISVDGVIQSLVIDQGKNFFSLNRESDFRIEWKDIVKIGEDVILIRKE